MITMRQIEDVSGPSPQVCTGAHPAFRFLRLGCALAGFGSRDLQVILPFEGKAVAKSVEMRLKIKPRFPVDLLVQTPEKIHERLALGAPFIRSILEKGKVLHEAHYG